MSPRDLVYVGHMLDMARKAVGKIRGLPRDGYDVDEDIVWQVVTEGAHRNPCGVTCE